MGDAYLELAGAAPKSRLTRLLLIDALPFSHATLAPLLGAVVRGGLRRGLPTLFGELKGLLRGGGEEGLRHGERLAARARLSAPLPPKGALLCTLAAACHAAASACAPLRAACEGAAKPATAAAPGAPVPAAA